jgi:hypothetical protein
MGKTSFIKEMIDQVRSIPKFIYNSAFVLSLMKRCTRNRELRHPAITVLPLISLLFNLCFNVSLS